MPEKFSDFTHPCRIAQKPPISWVTAQSGDRAGLLSGNPVRSDKPTMPHAGTEPDLNDRETESSTLPSSRQARHPKGRTRKSLLVQQRSGSYACWEKENLHTPIEAIPMAFTYFFRDGQALDLLSEHVIPDMATRRYMDVWDAGCAMGPEPYSIAITFREHMGPFLFRNLRIWATDVDETNTFGQIIARGVYCEQETKRIPREIRARHFSPIGGDGSLQVSEEIRKTVRFQKHDLLSLEPIREQFSLIVCKNVLLHFSPQERVEVMKMFHRTLSESGYLVTERTQEMPPGAAHLFSRVTSAGQLFKKRAPNRCEPRSREDKPHEALGKLTFDLTRRQDHGSAYDWMNIDCGTTRVGKVRGLIKDKRLTIHSINIFPEFERHGYGRETVEMFQAAFDTIVADRVRYTAAGFWKKMGFDPERNGHYVWTRRS